MNRQVTLGENPLSISDVVQVANRRATLALSSLPHVHAKIVKSHDFLHQLLMKRGEVYGVTTGYGDSCTTRVDGDAVSQLPLNLVRYHGCGMGDFFSEEETRAIQVTRLASLMSGVSGVSLELIQFLTDQLSRGISPRIPKEGSVGASGDLTPLSYLAATVVGEGEVLFQGRVYPTRQLYTELNIHPIGLKPKEGLAIMNGTSVMTALACIAYERAAYLCEVASRITAMNVVAMMGNPDHFDPFLFQSKPHPGQAEIARWIRSDIHSEFVRSKSSRLQDRYSLRCAPHVIGVLRDSLPFFKSLIETELNSANDNPLIDVDRQRIVHGGNFYGGHIAFAMDSMKVLIANVADLLDRQLALLVDPKFNNGLPANLTGTRQQSNIHHGLKAVQIATSAWTAEALKGSLPASIFSRSTECHNQDKVSMGTISARDCIRTLELSEQVCAAGVFAGAQALQIRKTQDQLSDEQVGPTLSSFRDEILAQVSFLEEDRPLDRDLRALVASIGDRKWELYA